MISRIHAAPDPGAGGNAVVRVFGGVAGRNDICVFPRRARILETLGVAFRVRISDVDETIRDGESGPDAAERLARAKASAVAALESLPVVAADTVVVCDGVILGKPSSPAHAAEMLGRLGGRTHQVVTGVCVAAFGRACSGVETTSVVFGAMSPEDVDWYVASGEPGDKAGAYHVDGCGALFVDSVAGSPSNVAGLPVRLLRRLLREANVDVGLP